MATFIKLLKANPESVVQETYERRNIADQTRLVEYNAAVKIQSWYKKILTRCYLKHLHKSALVIQRRWRGYLGRQFCRIRIRNLVMIMRMNFYNNMVVRIQKQWRGYYVRKYIHNFYARKRYLEALAIKNQIVRSELDELKEQMDMDAKRRDQDRAEKKFEYMARKNHYLLSTRQIRGIYNSPFREIPHEMEFRLRAVRPLDRDSRKPKPEPQTLGIVDDSPLPDKPQSAKEPLPPLTERRIQGPFKSRSAVLKQRYRPLNPSLRTSTDYESLENARDILQREEWTQRIHERPFLPATRRTVPYEPLLHTRSQYHELGFADQFCVRKERVEKNISKDRMRTVVSPIPVFEKFGQTYSKGSVVLQ